MNDYPEIFTKHRDELTRVTGDALNLHRQGVEVQPDMVAIEALAQSIVDTPEGRIEAGTSQFRLVAGARICIQQAFLFNDAKTGSPFRRFASRLEIFFSSVDPAVRAARRSNILTTVLGVDEL